MNWFKYRASDENIWRESRGDDMHNITRLIYVNWKKEV